MFTIQHLNSRAYFHNKGRIILFESEQEAHNFANLFVQYSIERLTIEGNIPKIMEVHAFISECQIKPVNFDVEKVKCGTVLAKELFENMERR